MHSMGVCLFYADVETDVTKQIAGYRHYFAKAPTKNRKKEDGSAWSGLIWLRIETRGRLLSIL
jgi:hypothetical protein